MGLMWGERAKERALSPPELLASVLSKVVLDSLDELLCYDGLVVSLQSPSAASSLSPRRVLRQLLPLHCRPGSPTTGPSSYAL